MSDRIAVLCASRDRPAMLKRAVDSCLSTSTRVDMKVYVDADQIQQYMHFCDWDALYGNRLEFTIEKRMGPNGSLNRLYQLHRAGYGIFGVTPDDSQFMVKGWDDFVIEKITNFPGRIGVVTPSHNDGDYCAYPYVSREWIDICGWYAYPEAHSFIWDTCQEMLGEATNIVYADEHTFRMQHDCLASENFDTYLRIDEHAFLGWCVVARRALVKKLRYAISSAVRREQDAVERGRA